MISVSQNAMPFTHKSTKCFIILIYIFMTKGFIYISAEKAECITAHLENEMQVERAIAGTGEY